MDKGILQRWVAGGLQAGAAFLFVMAGAEEEVLVVPAAIAGIAGLQLWVRAALRPPPPPPAAVEPPASQGQLAQVQDLLLALQDEVGRLREDQEFYRDLYAGVAERPRALRDQGDR